MGEWWERGTGFIILGPGPAYFPEGQGDGLTGCICLPSQLPAWLFTCSACGGPPYALLFSAVCEY